MAQGTMTKTMRAAAIDEFGGPISVHELPVPEVGPGEVLIRVEAGGGGVWDPFEMEGGFAGMMGRPARFPYVPGSDGAGTVEEVGEGVRPFAKGDRVYAAALANPKGGFYAEYIVLPASGVSRIPGTLTVEEAGVMPVDAVTALRGLDDTLGIKPGESVLVFGASGGVGHLAVQLAKRMGARVLAAASGADGVEMVRELGADEAVDGRRDDVAAAARRFAPGGLNAALLCAGGEAAERALEAVRDGGRVAYPNGVEPVPRGRKGIEVRSYDGEASPEVILRLNRWIERGPFRVHIARMFSLEEVEEAHRMLKQHFLGKIGLRP